MANPLRLRVVAELGGRVHVSELARRLGISRPLLYMHLDRLEKAGLITGHLELSEDGKAMKYFELAPFELKRQRRGEHYRGVRANGGDPSPAGQARDRR